MDDLIKIGGSTGTVLSNIAGYDVSWNDISDNSTRNAQGNMRLNLINDKRRIDITTTYLTQTQLYAFFSSIPVGELTVYYFDPYTGTYLTKQFYRGDRKVSMQWDLTDKGKLYKPVSIALIEL
jgi:hypothetical protein